MNNTTTKKLILAAFFLSLGFVLPFLTGQIPSIGKMLLPLHIPVLLCGLICGWQYGLGVGFILPLMRSALFAAPVLYPTAIAMAFELATYGFVIGLLYSRSKWQCVRALYRCLIIAMLAGRVSWGIVEVLLLGLGGQGFTFQAFVMGAFVNAVPGIALQLLLIPAVMLALDRTHLVCFRKPAAKDTICAAEQ